MTIWHWHQRHLDERSLTERAADAVAGAACSFQAFEIACATVIIWGLSGPHFAFSDTWQLVINTGTTIVTFLMAFLIGNNQIRQASRDRLHAQHDYEVNLLSKEEIEQLQHELSRIENEKLDRIIEMLADARRS